LRSNSNPPGEDDGDHPTIPLASLANGPAPVTESKKVREVHATVKNYLNKEDDGQLSSFGNYPGFVSMLEQNLGGEISCTHHLFKA